MQSLRGLGFSSYGVADLGFGGWVLGLGIRV